jgi:hypothetical protein
MKNFLLTLSLIILPLVCLLSQETANNTEDKNTGSLHLESGFIYPDGKIREGIAVRQNISSYYVDQSATGHVYSETYGIFFSLKYEYFIGKFNTGISTGLRYTGFQSTITGNSSDKADFFYLRYSEVNTDTKFARVKDITETKGFVTIPVELRFIPFHYRNIALFARVGVEFSILNPVKKTNIDFQEVSMEAYQDEVLNNIAIQPDNFYSTLYGSLGITIGKKDKPHYIFEVSLPSLFLSRNNFALTEINSFSGFKLSVQIPLKKSN